MARLVVLKPISGPPKSLIPASERMVELVIMVFQGRIISSRSVAQHFGISLRTAHRDIARIAFLLDVCGEHHYRLSPQYRHR